MFRRGTTPQFHNSQPNRSYRNTNFLPASVQKNFRIQIGQNNGKLVQYTINTLSNFRSNSVQTLFISSIEVSERGHVFNHFQ